MLPTKRFHVSIHDSTGRYISSALRDLNLRQARELKDNLNAFFASSGIHAVAKLTDDQDDFTN